MRTKVLNEDPKEGTGEEMAWGGDGLGGGLPVGLEGGRGGAGVAAVTSPALYLFVQERAARLTEAWFTASLLTTSAVETGAGEGHPVAAGADGGRQGGQGGAGGRDGVGLC